MVQVSRITMHELVFGCSVFLCCQLTNYFFYELFSFREFDIRSCLDILNNTQPFPLWSLLRSWTECNKISILLVKSRSTTSILTFLRLFTFQCWKKRGLSSRRFLFFEYTSKEVWIFMFRLVLCLVLLIFCVFDRCELFVQSDGETFVQGFSIHTYGSKHGSLRFR